MISRSERNKKVVKEINREKTLKRSKIMLTITGIICLVFISFYLYVRYIGTSFIKTNEYIVRNTNIPASFHGTKILHLSDLLYGSTIDTTDLEKLENEISIIKPDIIIFTGDLIFNKFNIMQEDIDVITNFLNNIEAKLGKYAIYGDMDNNTFNLIMNNTDFVILNNENTLIYNKENTPISLTGLNINDLKTLNIDNNYFKISLIHNYDFYNNFQVNSNLVLAGHNLNGEIRFPFTKGLLGNNYYNDRYYYLNNTEIHISNGLGSIHKMRLFNHPSINVYRLYNN